MRSTVTTVEEYLQSLPPDRREAVEALRRTILANLDSGYEETMQYGMIGYCVPHRVYPPGYHCNPRDPLPFAGIASQKQAISLYLMGVYMSPDAQRAFREAWLKAGKKLDMGASCVRFKRLEDVPLDVVAQTIRAMPAKTYIAMYEAILGQRRAKSAPKKASPKPPPGTRNTARKKAPRKATKKPARKPAAKRAKPARRTRG